MPKNVVLCCDGTANEFAKDRTNVVKLFFTLVRDPAGQVAYYHPGSRHDGAARRADTGNRIATRFAGQAFGYGLETDIRDAYVFLMNNFEEGDRCLPVRVQSRRLYRAGGGIAASNVRAHSERQ